MKNVIPGDGEDTYVLTPAAGGGIEAFSCALARRLAELDRLPMPQVVVLSGFENDSPYVQCLIPHAPGVWMEAVSNRFLAGTAWELTPDQERVLVELGWHPPEPERGGDDPEPPYEVVNWWQAWERPVDTSELASRLVVTLVLAYGLSDREPWVLRTFAGTCDGDWDRPAS